MRNRPRRRRGAQIVDRADNRLNARIDLLYEAGPGIDRDPSSRDDIVDEIPVARAQVEHARVRGDAVAEEIAPQRGPHAAATGVHLQSRTVIVAAHA